MVFVLLGQLILSSLALARQADVDLMAYDAWDRAYVRDKPALAKLEKTVRRVALIVDGMRRDLL